MIRFESWTTSSPSTSTGTRRWRVSSSISGRPEAPVRDPLGPVVEPELSEPPRDGAAGAEHVGAGGAAVEDDPSGRSTRSPSRMNGATAASATSCGPRPCRTRSPSSVHLPAHGVLERLLVRPGLEAELPACLRVPVGPPAARRAHLVGRDRDREARHATISLDRQEASDAAGSFTGAGSRPEIRARSAKRRSNVKLRPREDVALARFALLVGEQVAGGDVADVDDVERRRRRRRECGPGGSGAPAPSTCPLGSSGPRTNDGLTITTGSPCAASRSASTSASCLELT